MRPSPRAKAALVQHYRPTLAPGWIGLLAFRESFDLRPAAIMLRLGAAAGTNEERHFGKSTPVDRTSPIPEPRRMAESARLVHCHGSCRRSLDQTDSRPQARLWESVQVPPRDLGRRLLGMGAVSASCSNSDQLEAQPEAGDR